MLQNGSERRVLKIDLARILTPTKNIQYCVVESHFSDLDAELRRTRSYNALPAPHNFSNHHLPIRVYIETKLLTAHIMSTLPTKQLGKNGPQVPQLGFGAMGLSAFNGPIDSDEQRLKLLDRAFDLGETFWDSADAYVSECHSETFEITNIHNRATAKT